MEYINIVRNEELRTYLKRFKEKGPHVISLDIEAECNCHCYGEKLCLVQVSDGVNDVIIDPFGIDKSTLKLLFEDPGILKIMYDAGSDLALLKNTLNITIMSILDLRPAVELIDYEKKDLHSVIASELGIGLTKKRKFQRYNWTKRPVSAEAIDYALNDVRHLFPLKDILIAKLYSRRLLDTFLLRNLQIQSKDYKRDPEDKYKKVSGYSSLHDDRKAVFRKVYDIRENHAKLYNMPPHNVIHKGDLINIVQDPGFISKLRFSKRFSAPAVQGILDELKRAVKTD